MAQAKREVNLKKDFPYFLAVFSKRNGKKSLAFFFRIHGILVKLWENLTDGSHMNARYSRARSLINVM